MRTSSQEARSSHSSPSIPKCCVKALRKERGARRGDGGGGSPAASPSLSLQFGFCTVAVVPSSSYVCALESEELQPALPGGEKGPGKESRGRRQGRPCPAGPSHGGAPGAQGPRIPPPLSSSLCSPPGAAWPAGVQPTLLRGRLGAAHQPESRDPRATHRSSRSPATAPPPRATSPRRRGVAAAGVWSSRRRLRCRLQGKRATGSAAAVTGRQERPPRLPAGVRARACSPPRARSHAPLAAHAHSAPPGRLCSLT